MPKLKVLKMKLNIYLPYDPAVPLLDIYLGGVKAHAYKKT